MHATQLTGRPPPTTFEAVEAVALREPRRLAVVEGKQGWTYEDFYFGLIRFTRALEGLGVQRGQRVAVSRPSFYLQLMLLIACENLGAVTASFAGEGDSDATALITLVDWVLSEATQECPPGVQYQQVDKVFVDRVMAVDPHSGPPCPRVSPELHEPQRLTRTSGSTGRSRFMLLSRLAQEQRIFRGTGGTAFTPETRLLISGPLVMNAAYTRACAGLRAGGAVLSLSGAELPGVAITHLWALPIRLEELLGELPPAFVAPRKIDVAAGGGFISQWLRQETLRVFGGRIVNRYGTNEAGGVCDDLDASGAGLLCAGVDVRILGEQGQEVAAGEAGIIAVRSYSMAEGYLGDDEATRAAFRDGWFYSGDRGALVAPRWLRLDGRHDDLLNIGGIKIAGARVEELIRELPGVLDCCVLSLNLPAGSATVGIVLAVASGTQREVLAKALVKKLPLGASTVARILFVDSLPRLAGGKADRMALHTLFRAG
ncbi:MAG: class I adenylate-forming enzyme family protein [Ramlibacter sp.]